MSTIVVTSHSELFKFKLIKTKNLKSFQVLTSHAEIMVTVVDGGDIEKNHYGKFFWTIFIHSIASHKYILKF